MRQRPTRRLAWVAGLAALVLAGAGVLLRSGGASPASDDQFPDPIQHGYRIVHSYPHDPDAFTQGLIFRDGALFESTGLNGKSRLRKVRLETGEVLREAPVAAEHFAEGLTDWGNELFQLTWQSHVGFVYELAAFKPRRTVTYPWEGWGLTPDNRRLMLSDGSATIRFLDPATFTEDGHIVATDRGRPVDRLNELEFVKGAIYANVWQTNRIAIIAPADGHVTGWIDLTGLRPQGDGRHPIDVLNGIAYDAAADRLFVTGKWWPTLFEISIGPA
jgi:glutamine cyclotransferase